MKRRPILNPGPHLRWIAAFKADVLAAVAMHVPFDSPTYAAAREASAVLNALERALRADAGAGIELPPAAQFVPPGVGSQKPETRNQKPESGNGKREDGAA